MAAIDEMPLAKVGASTDVNAIRAIINGIFWDWFVLHQNNKVKTVNFWIIHRTMYVRDFKDLFVLLVGPSPRA